MSPSVVDAPHRDHDTQDEVNPRPLKRARKSSSKPRSEESNSNHNIHDPNPPQPPPPLGHIFITDGFATKKQSGKKVPLSCCECRRLKLKCDRSFPCASCKKRGCAEICPDGVLVSGKGTRFILANTEQLHSKIHEMSDRIRSLEEALEALQSQVSEELHTLMIPGLLSIKSTVGLYNSSQSSHDKDHTGGGQDKCEGPSQDGMDKPSSCRSASEDNFPGGNTAISTIPGFGMIENIDYEAVIEKISHNFPLSDKVLAEQPNLPLRQHLRTMLPVRSEAQYLWEQTSQNALWQWVSDFSPWTVPILNWFVASALLLTLSRSRYNPHLSTNFFPTLLHHCYESPLQDLCPRQMSVMFMILAVGCQVDTNRHPPDTSPPGAERYHQYARAALCEIPVMEDTTVMTILALFYEIWYLLVFSDKKKAAGYAWGLMGLTAKLAQSIGLHRNWNKAKVVPEEVEKRRALFWELLYLDARLSLSLGRPPSLSISYTDCPRPSYGPGEGCDPTESLHYYHEWKHSCYVQCLAPVLDAISNPSLDYSEVLNLDRRIRDFSIPAPLRNGQSRALFLQRGSLSNAFEAVLLQLHRAWFIRALNSPEEPMNRWNKYLPSVVAVFLSASRMIATIEDLFQREPRLTARLLGYWSNAFSSAVALCLFVSRAPFTSLAVAALQELQRAQILFTKAADTCLRASEVKPMLEVMIDKANDIYNRWSQGQDIPNVLKHHFEDCISEGEDRRYQQGYAPSPHRTDSFAYAHPSLAQCIVEVHQRTKELFPMHKNCQCQDAKRCPSPSWVSRASLPHVTPVLPGLTSPVLAHAGLYKQNDAGATTTSTGSTGFFGPTGPQAGSSLASSSLSIVNPLNIEIGAISISNDQGLMSFF